MARDVRRATLHLATAPLYGKVTATGPDHLLTGAADKPVTRCGVGPVRVHTPGRHGHISNLCPRCQAQARREIRERRRGD